MSLKPGSSVGPYEVVAPLGAGGMGEVYRATDTRLNRNVAIKVLAASVADDPERLARFTREAQTLAALNHPNIAAIYGVENYGAGARALIMELVEGEDLSMVIGRGPLPVAEALPIARQIADALEAAHDLGIVHRDLKPANVKVRADGTVKVLDFGLARTLDQPAPGSASGDPAPTMTSPAMTAMGMILGTAAYMAPEQARGRAVDRRADIWSFGVVLFEMLTGRRLFDGDDVSVTLAGVLKDEPDWRRLPASTPAAVSQLLRRCLVKDPKQRLQSIGEARIQIEGLLSGSLPTVPPEAGASQPGRSARWPWAVAAASVAALAVTLVWWGPWQRADAANAGPVRVSVTMPADLRVRDYRISPDGTRLVLLARSRTEEAAGSPVARLYVRALDAYDARPIPGTDGARSFSFSPDGRWLAVLVVSAENTADRRLTRVPVDGSSPPVLLAHWDPAWPESTVWLEDGDLLTWVPAGGKQALLRIPSGGGGPRPQIPLQLEDGVLLGRVGRRLPGDRGVFVSIDTFGARGYQTNVGLVDPTTGAVTRLIDDAAEPVYLESGHVVFSRGDTVLASAFDLERRTVSGEVTALEAGLSSVAGPAAFGLSDSGTLTYAPIGENEFDRRLVTVAADGRLTPFVPQVGRLTPPLSVSRDGTRALVTVLNQTATYEVWMADATRGTFRRLVAFPSADASSGLWSPDGLSLVYAREGLTESDGLYVQRVDGTVEPRRISGDFKEAFIGPQSWLPDGAGLIVTRRGAGESRDLFLLPVGKDGPPLEARPLRTTPHDDSHGVVSPDGRWMAFSSDESGRREVYIADFSGGRLGPAIMVSDGACGPSQWVSPRRLVYCTTPGRLVSVDIASTPALSVSTPVVLHDLQRLRIDNAAWAMLPDGRLLVIQRDEAEDSLGSINLVLNWGADLRRRLSTQRSVSTATTGR